MPERDIGYIMAAHGIGSTFTNEVIARIGNLLDLIDHILLRTDGLEIGAMFYARPGHTFDCPHQIGRDAGDHYAHGDPSSLELRHVSQKWEPVLG
ncbi:hypothetical protein D9M72_608720 [compost metagenome]